MSRPVNILFIMTDDHTVREMGCYGAVLPPTPNLDRFATAGTRSDNAFCTNALCAPSRATVLTGAFSHVHGVRGNSEGADQIEELDPRHACLFDDVEPSRPATYDDTYASGRPVPGTAPPAGALRRPIDRRRLSC